MSTSNCTTIHRTYQLRGYTSRAGYGRVREVLRVCQRLYNRVLAERKAIYRLTGKNMNKYAQMKWLTGLRRESQQLHDVDIRIERGVLMRLDRAYQSFFRRVKAGEKAGFPRFKPHQRYTCLELAEVRAGMVKGNKIKIKGLPAIRVRPSRPLPESTPVSLRLVMRGRILIVDLVYEETMQPLSNSDAAVGIDMGVNERMTLSDGQTVDKRVVDRSREKRLQRAVSRSQKGSRTRCKRVQALALERRRIAIQNRNECHRITTDLVRRYGLIAIEDLRVQNMTRKGGNHKKGLNREVLGQTWGLLKSQLRYKAEWAGRQLAEVNPAYTSRACFECGLINGKSRNYRLFECQGCGHTQDRDVNAARNILQRGWNLLVGGHNGGGSGLVPCSQKDMPVELGI